MSVFRSRPCPDALLHQVLAAGAVYLLLGVVLAGTVPSALPFFNLALLGGLLLGMPVFIRYPEALAVLLGVLAPIGLLGRIELAGGLPLFHSILHVVGLVLALAWIGSLVLTDRRMRISWPWMALTGVVFLAFLLSLGSEWPGNSTGAMARYYVPFLGLAFLLVNVVDRPSTLRLVLTGLVVGVCVTAVSMILTSLGSFSIEGVLLNAQGRQGSFSGGIASTGLYLVIALGVGLGLSHGARGWTRVGWMVAIGLLGTGLVLTVSLTSIGAGLVLVLARYVPGERGLIRGMGAVLVRGVPLAAVAVALITVVSPLFVLRIQGKWVDLASESVYLWGSGRVGLGLAGLQMIEDHALTGVGVGNAGLALVPYVFQVPAPLDIPIKDGVLVKVPDNTFVEVFSEFGVPLGSAFALILVFCVVRLVREGQRRRWRGDEGALVRAILLASLGIAVFAFFNDVMTDKVSWFVLGCVLAWDRASVGRFAQAAPGVSPAGSAPAPVLPHV